VRHAADLGESVGVEAEARNDDDGPRREAIGEDPPVQRLEPLLGPAAPLLFGAGLFAAGLTSSITAPLAAAYAAGGALETVRDGETGVLFREPTAASLRQALERVTDLTIDPAHLVRHAAQFDASVFRSKLRRAIDVTVERTRATKATT